EGLHYSLEHPSTLILDPRFTKIIVSHYMIAFPEISQRVRDKYHNLEDDEMVKSIFNSEKNKARVGMKISSWMITDESTQGIHKATSTPRTPNPGMDEGESSVPRKYNVIRLCIPLRRSTRLTSPTPVPTIAEVKDKTLQNTIQLSIAEQKSRDDFEARQNVEKVNEHLVAEEIEKMVEGTKNVENVEVDNSISHSQNDPNTRFMPRKKFYVLAQHLQEVMEDSLPKMIDARIKELTKTQVPIYVAHRLIMERQQSQANVGNMIIDAIQQERENLRAEISLQINNAITNHIPSQASNTPCRTFAIRPRDQDDPHNDAHLERENSAKRQKTSEHGTYVFGESSSGQVNESEPDPSTSVYDIIYKNNKKEKRVMRHQEIHKFCNATLKRVLEGLKSYNNNVKHGYVTPSLNKEDVEYLQLFEEEIEERLKHRDQMRHWEMYVNGRPLGSRREHLE
nr:hypothetical protein [Tanacetum cinerariifolium]